MDQQNSVYAPDGQESAPPLFVKDWINSIQYPSTPEAVDALTTLDTKADSSIGGFGTNMEYVLNTQRLVPLFEFRRLARIPASGYQAFVTAAEAEVVALHTHFTNATRLLKKRHDVKYSHIKRQDDPTTTAACPLAAPPPTTPTPTVPKCYFQGSDPNQGAAGRAVCVAR